MSLQGIAGIDEAGRGPVVGPMVICGVLFMPDIVPELRVLGVRDSKTLTPQSREKMVIPIKKLAKRFALRTVDALEIDQLRARGITLNEIELQSFVSIAKELQPAELYLDAADVIAERFGNQIGQRSFLSEKGCRIVSEHKADSKYEVVAAASIIAKVQRDTLIAQLHSKHGDFGSGYPNDPRTVDFIRKIAKSGSELPDIIRKSWESVSRIMEENNSIQTNLDTS
ncbi:MAG: ribonuclease HII [Candidatus Thorarchaeota archaeon]|nr:ribonuclease HII [Candidatus Thorarchaeota archaeon]